jgi:Holliday junction resolvasome RuvABC endonuclease subunit
MTIIYGFDPSKSTGFAIYDTKRHYSAIKCGVLEMPKGADHYFTGDQIGLKVKNLIKDNGRPDFVVLEQQILAKVGNTSADAMIYPWIATSAIVATIANFGIPYGTLMPSTWRKSFYGQSFHPPLDPKGKKDWKAAAVAHCEQLGITLPAQKALGHNAAEACALAICWGVKDMKLHAGRYHAPWVSLIQSRNERAPAGDLFAGAGA